MHIFTLTIIPIFTLGIIILKLSDTAFLLVSYISSPCLILVNTNYRDTGDLLYSGYGIRPLTVLIKGFSQVMYWSYSVPRQRTIKNRS